MGVGSSGGLWRITPSTAPCNGACDTGRCPGNRQRRAPLLQTAPCWLSTTAAPRPCLPSSRAWRLSSSQPFFCDPPHLQAAPAQLPSPTAATLCGTWTAPAAGRSSPGLRESRWEHLRAARHLKLQGGPPGCLPGTCGPAGRHAGVGGDDARQQAACFWAVSHPSTICVLLSSGPGKAMLRKHWVNRTGAPPTLLRRLVRLPACRSFLGPPTPQPM